MVRAMPRLTRRRALTAGVLTFSGLAACDHKKPVEGVTGRRPLWRAALPYAYGGGYYSVQQVAVWGGTVVVSDRGTLHGYVRGARRWTSPYGPFDNSGRSATLPSVTDGTVVTLRNQRGSVATLFGTDVSTGNRRWLFAGHHVIPTSTSAGPGDPPPAAAGGLVHFVTGLRLYTLDAATGAVRWKHDGTGHSFGPPVVCGGLVVVADARGLTALDATTGKVRWRRHDVNGGLLASPRVLYVISLVITALDVRTGRTLWSTSRGDWTRSGTTAEALRYGGQVTFAGDSLYLTNGGRPGAGSAWALNAADGRVRWSYRSPDVFGGPASVSGDTVYCDAANGRLYALDARTGGLRWRAEARAATVNPPTTAGGVVYTIVQLVDGSADYLYAFPG